MASRRLPSTKFLGVIAMKRAPQKVKPSPMKARIWDSVVRERTSERAPEIRKKAPILVVEALRMVRLVFTVSQLFVCSPALSGLCFCLRIVCGVSLRFRNIHYTFHTSLGAFPTETMLLLIKPCSSKVFNVANTCSYFDGSLVCFCKFSIMSAVSMDFFSLANSSTV